VIHEEMKHRRVLSGLATPVFHKCTVKILGKGKGKAIPILVCTGPESSRRIRLPYVQTNSAWKW